MIYTAIKYCFLVLLVDIFTPKPGLSHSVVSDSV